MKLNEIKVSNPYLELPNSFYDFVVPSPLNNPYLVSANEYLAKELNIDINELYTKYFVNLINGSYLLNGSIPFAMVYAGHQFGHYVPRLGDGRAINIGTINNMHLQIKGAGVTKYSRSGDGRAVLRSSIREYLISEAMCGLNIPTTRALGIIGSTHKVFRESWETGATVLRVSPSWIRVGTFEYFAHNNMLNELKLLLDYSIKESYPHLQDVQDRYRFFFLEVVGKSAKLVAKWMSFGFNHGVMNTDNTSIAGLTIDYGPFAFLDDYRSDYICNHTDVNGRYSFKNQPSIMKWNLKALMNALSKIVDIKSLEPLLEYFDTIYYKEYIYLMGKKLGLKRATQNDMLLIKDLLNVLEELQIDYTLFFRELSYFNGDKNRLLKLALYKEPLINWLNRYEKRVQENSISFEDINTEMLQTNPKYVLKNYMLQEAIDDAQSGDFTKVNNLLKIAKNPYSEHKEFEEYSFETPNKYKNLKLSCSS